MFTCNFTTKFKRDYKRVLKRGWDMNLFENVYDLLAEKGELPQNYKSHALTGNWIGYIDAHIQPNWVLIYKINKSDFQDHKQDEKFDDNDQPRLFTPMGLLVNPSL